MYVQPRSEVLCVGLKWLFLLSREEGEKEEESALLVRHEPEVFNEEGREGSLVCLHGFLLSSLC